MAESPTNDNPEAPDPKTPAPARTDNEVALELMRFIANTTGWIFTEMGRQPWVVYGLLKTSAAVSHIGTGYVVTSLIGFTAIYSLLAAIDFGLMARFARGEGEPDEHDDEPEPEPGSDRAPALVY